MKPTRSPRPAVRTELWGFPPRPADVELVPFPRRRRLLRAAKPLALLWGVGAVLAVATLGTDLLITPLIFVAGATLAYKAWRSECRVVRFDGACPRCGSSLPLEPGQAIRLPQKLHCFTCHSRPVLHVEAS